MGEYENRNSNYLPVYCKASSQPFSEGEGRAPLNPQHFEVFRYYEEIQIICSFTANLNSWKFPVCMAQSGRV
ncbi:MAG TPA: hypothetical protein VFI29_07100 [Hanamia sp.]|nr:hypothetical protein [Hanamia sp.]